jgi:hypothetical protein
VLCAALSAAGLSLTPSAPWAQEANNAGNEAENKGASKEENKEENKAQNRRSTAPANPEEERFRFFLTDGSKVTGKLSLSHIELSTEFGRLEVPVTKLLEVVPGLDQRPEELQELEQLISMLGKSDKESAQARDKLIEMGVEVRELLREQRDEAAAKQQAEIDKVLSQLDELAMDEVPTDDALIPDDRVRTAKFTAIGKILSEKFQIETAWGDLTVSMADVERLERLGAGGLPDARKTMDVDSSNFAQTRFKDSGIEIQPGDKIVVRASGNISRSTSRIYTSTPDGNTRFGTYSTNPPIIGGTLIAKIGNSANLIRIGSSSTFVAKQGGMLRFAIAMRPEYVGRFQYNGKYSLQVRVLRGEQ